MPCILLILFKKRQLQSLYKQKTLNKDDRSGKNFSQVVRIKKARHINV